MSSGNISYSPPIELAMHVRHTHDVRGEDGNVIHKAGDPTGRMIQKVSTSGGEAISETWSRNKYVPKKGRKKAEKAEKTKQSLPSDKQAQSLLDIVNKNAEEVAKKRDEQIQQ
jgi:hypothetical protein